MAKEMLATTVKPESRMAPRLCAADAKKPVENAIRQRDAAKGGEDHDHGIAGSERYSDGSVDVANVRIFRDPAFLIPGGPPGMRRTS